MNAHNPPGSKMLRKAYKHKQGERGTYQEALKWYRALPDGLAKGKTA